MNRIRFIALLLITSIFGCDQQSYIVKSENDLSNNSNKTVKNTGNQDLVNPDEQIISQANHFISKGQEKTIIRKALLSTAFKSFTELKKSIKITYHHTTPISFPYRGFHQKPFVRLAHFSDGQKVISELFAGISEKDFVKARDGNFWDKANLAIDSPYFVINRNDLLRVFILARRRGDLFGEGDVAFYHLAENMLFNISDEDLANISSEDLSEKGFINTFNHITAQAFMTTLFSEKLADFIADNHERRNMPELIKGVFTNEQFSDLETGPVDNYVDIINNEWGQELGKKLKKKFMINGKTTWTPALLADYLNDIQLYYSRSFQIGFKPFRIDDEKVIKFSNKINKVMKDLKSSH